MGQLTRDGVALAFTDVGKGALPIMLVHELTGDCTWFAPQIEHFRHRHRVVAVDLRGHGQSDKPKSGYSIAGLADDLAWLCYELGVYKPVVIGHGLGGLIALDLAARYSDLPAAISALDAPILPPGTQENAIAWDGALALASCRVPVLYVDGGSQATDLDRLQEICPRLIVNRLDGAGHFLQLKEPDQVNAVLDRFIALLPELDLGEATL